MTKSEEMIAFYFELGIAITQWAELERSLYNITATCIPRAERMPLADSFFSIDAFRSKLKFSDALLSKKLKGTTHAADWAKSVLRLKSLASSRNKIAHYPHGAFPQNVSGRVYALIPWVVEESNIKPNSKVAKPPKGSLCVRDINRIRFEFFAANMTLMNLSARIEGAEEFAPKSAERVMHPLTIRQLRSQIYATLAPPPKLSQG